MRAILDNHVFLTFSKKGTAGPLNLQGALAWILKDIFTCFSGGRNRCCASSSGGSLGDEVVPQGGTADVVLPPIISSAGVTLASSATDPAGAGTNTSTSTSCPPVS